MGHTDLRGYDNYSQNMGNGDARQLKFMSESASDFHESGGVRLLGSRYGKARVRVARVERGADGVQNLREVSVDLLVEGDFAASYTEADNALVLPTDTMKNTVYVLAARHGIEGAEAFGVLLGRYLLERNPAMRSVEATLRETRWERLTVEGGPHPHGFRAPGFGQPTARVVTSWGGDGQPHAHVESGVNDLCLLKTTGSEFKGYLKDDLTTLPETDDRIFSTLLTARWLWSGAPPSYEVGNAAALAAMTAVFADEHSISVQASLFSMARAALERVPEIAQVTLRMPNRHYLPFDLTRYGLENTNTIFYPTDEPHGQIEATVGRE